MDNNKSYYYVLSALLIVVLGVFGIYIYARNSTYTVNLSVNSLTWQRIIPIEVFKVLHEDTYESSIPNDAYNIHKYTSSHYQSETCTSSSSEVDSKGKSHIVYHHYECGHTVTDYMAKYDINRWVWDHNLINRGTVHDEITWPNFIPLGNGELGSLRAGARQEILTVNFDCINHASLIYTATDNDDWRKYSDGESYTVQINRLEQVYWDTIQKVNKQ